MNHDVTIAKTDDLDLVNAFAATFGHHVERGPVHIVNVDGSAVAYLEMLPKMVVFPALHPKLLTPRLFHEVSWKVLGALKSSFGDPWICESPVAPLGARKLAHVGLVPLEFPVFRIERSL